tara:strand:+ start:988 stop:1500 length:513 start_codon:yes stop_codon:yes gene_type:complete
MNITGRFMQDAFSKGQPFRNQLTEIRNQAGAMYNKATGPAASEMQAALVQLLDPIEENAATGTKGKAARFAASKEAKQLLQALPAAAAGAGALAVGDIVSGGESMSNDAMDLLGMGAGAAAAYGVNRGVGSVGGSTAQGSMLGGRTPAQKLAIIASAIGGKTAMDTLQGG